MPPGTAPGRPPNSQSPENWHTRPEKIQPNFPYFRHYLNTVKNAATRYPTGWLTRREIVSNRCGAGISEATGECLMPPQRIGGYAGGCNQGSQPYRRTHPPVASAKPPASPTETRQPPRNTAEAQSPPPLRCLPQIRPTRTESEATIPYPWNQKPGILTGLSRENRRRAKC